MDMISELPDSILLHILDLMEPKQAVQTCLLSKRWKNLCKQLTNLTFTFSPDPTPNYLVPWIRSVKSFENFTSWILYTRDHSCSLHNLCFHTCTDPELSDSLVKYAVLHDIRHLEIRILSCYRFTTVCTPLLFSSHSLTSLSLCIYHGWNPSRIILPKTLHLPSIKRLHLDGFTFTASDNHSAEPFSMCRVLHNLELQYCELHDDAQVLCISNSTLSGLTIIGQEAPLIVFSTPSLSSLTFQGSDHHDQLLSTCNLPSLGEVNIDVNIDFNGRNPFIMKWLQMLSNVKILTLYSCAFKLIHDLSNLISMRPQPPRFARLETLNVPKLYSEKYIEEISTVVDYLLQNSPLAKVDIKVISGSQDLMRHHLTYRDKRENFKYAG
uniref:F-box/FBD/LRR-repeat protein At1g78750 family n=1 Tax=Cajanus cajan TaxID=3821 RepID=A0A151T4E7_CAJCA|nr:F-box/FBD/LRR-repeat protein At1g78750 family [Cajanus cajan]